MLDSLLRKLINNFITRIFAGAFPEVPPIIEKLTKCIGPVNLFHY